MAEPTERIAILLELQQQEFEKRAKRAGRAIDRLEKKFNPLAAAEAKLTKQQTVFNAALEAGTIDAAQYAKGMDLLQREYDQTIAKTTKLKNNVVNMNSAVSAQNGFMSRNRSVFQQAGYQVGDFAVQVQGGQSALVAFSQQGSQLLGVFGPLGAVMGAGLAVGSSLAGVLLRMADGAEDAAEELAEMDALNLSGARSEISGLIDLQDKLALAIIQNATLRTEASQKAVESIGKEYEAELALLNLRAVETENSLRRKRVLLEDYQKELREIAEAARAEAEAGFAEVSDNAGLRTRQKQIADFILAAIDANEELLGNIKQVEAEISLAEITSEELAEALDDAGIFAEEIADANIENNIGAGADEAARLAKNLGISLETATNLANLGPQGGGAPSGGRGGDPRDQGGGFYDWKNREAIIFNENWTPPKPDKGSGGGSRSGGAQNIFGATEREISALRQSIEFLGKSKAEVAELAAKYRLLEAAKKAGIDVTEEMAARIDAEASKIGKLTEEYEFAQESMKEWETFADTWEDALVNAASGAEGAFDSLREAIVRAALQYALFGSSGAGGLIGGAASAMGIKLPSFDGGGYTGNGSRSGGLDGKGGQLALLHPQETVVDHTKGQSAGGSGSVHVVVSADESGNLLPLIESVSGNVVASAAPAIQSGAVSAVQKRMSKSKSFGAPA